MKTFRKIRGEWMRECRLELGMTIRSLAEVLGVSHSFVSQIETGARNLPENLWASWMWAVCNQDIANFNVDNESIQFDDDVTIDQAWLFLVQIKQGQVSARQIQRFTS